ncbi:MAG: response regulator [Chitinophagaceae bacterium]|nr:MAG: response regulator [Chitinophagaceae bacterium]
MSYSNYPIIVVDDDADDLDLFTAAYNELNFDKELLVFQSAELFLDYLKTARLIPFLIISDFNMPQVNGLRMRQILNNNPDLRYKSIPFVIWTTVANSSQVKAAYDNIVQGYFEKPSEFNLFKEQLRTLIEYWHFSKQPNI